MFFGKTAKVVPMALEVKGRVCEGPFGLVGPSLIAIVTIQPRHEQRILLSATAYYSLNQERPTQWRFNQYFSSFMPALFGPNAREH